MYYSLLINVYIKISSNLGGNFWNLGSNFLAFQWATFQHFTSTIGKGLVTPPKWVTSPTWGPQGTKGDPAEGERPRD